MWSIETVTKLAKITANIKALNDVENSLLALIEMEFPFRLIEVCRLKTVVRRIPTYDKFDKLKEVIYKKFDEMEQEDKENKAAEEKKKRPASKSGEPSAKRKPVVKEQKSIGVKKAPPPVISTAFKGFTIPKKQKSEEAPAVTGPLPLMSLKVDKPAWI